MMKIKMNPTTVSAAADYYYENLREEFFCESVEESTSEVWEGSVTQMDNDKSYSLLGENDFQTGFFWKFENDLNEAEMNEVDLWEVA